MIDKEIIENLINPKLDELGFYLVDLSVKSGNRIELDIDSISGVSVNDCMEVSRFINENLDREVEDFELLVSSPGADKPLKMYQQYIKNIGRDVKVETNEGKKFEAELKEANENTALFYYKERVKVEGKKSKKLVENNLILPYSDIKEAKVVIKFK